MTVLSIILGVLLVIGGFACMFTPLATFASAGYLLAVVLFAYGVIAIIRFIQKRATGLELFVGILALLAGLVALFNPGESLVLDTIVLYITAGWFIVQGIVDIVVAISTRKVNPGWGWGIVIGILALVAGIYSFAHPIVLALTAGILIGLYFIEAGFSMIIMGCAFSTVKED